MELLTTYSMRKYAEKHGYAFKLETQPAEVAASERQAYWAKIGLIRKYLDQGFDWVVYTDVDVYFLNHKKLIQEFLGDKDIITVGECTVTGPEGRNGTKYIARSGFMILRNTPTARTFLDTWESSFEFYKEIENPEQSAFETMQASPEWGPAIHLNDWSTFHSYDTCDRGFDSFSIHFPGHQKLPRVAKAFLMLSFAGQSEWAWAAEDGKLREHAGAIVRDALDNYRTKSPAPNGAEPFEPTNEEANEVRYCLDNALIKGYEGVRGAFGIGPVTIFRS